MKTSNVHCKVDLDYKVDSNGAKRWYNQYGQKHRENGLPAIEYADGHKVWYFNDICHRENGLPAIESIDGSKIWYDAEGYCYRFDTHFWRDY